MKSKYINIKVNWKINLRPKINENEIILYIKS